MAHDEKTRLRLVPSQDPDLRSLSASQVKKFLGCQARWGACYLAGLSEPEGKQAALGKEVHSQMEAWIRDGTMPTNKIALALLKHSPAPRTALVERGVSFSTSQSKWRGFVDVTFGVRAFSGTIEEIGPSSVWVVQDWKTTSSLEYALSEEELQRDPQACLYAYEAYLQGAKAVRLRWVYVATKGAPHTRVVEVPCDRSQVERVVSNLDGVAERIQELYRSSPDWRTLPKNISQCFAYRVQCPFYDECKPVSRLKMPETKGDSMQAFKDKLASFPGAVGKPPALPPKAPPSLPPAKPPALPTKAAASADLSEAEVQALVEAHLAAQGKTRAYHASDAPVVERGFVNSLAAPEVPAATPEEAYATQSGGAVSEETVDDLTSLNREQLRALCVVEGLDLGRKRPSEDTLRAMLRENRKTAKKPEPLDVFVGAFTPPSTPANPDTGLEFSAGLLLHESVRVEMPDVASISDADKAARRIPGVKLVAFTTPSAPADPLPLGVEPLPFAKEPAELSSMSPKALVLELHQIMDEAHKKLHAELDEAPRDYRQIGYGKGPGLLCLAVQDLFESGRLRADVVVSDSATPEGSTLKVTLTALARSGRFVLVDGLVV